jgi:hypothetical protein
MLANVRRAHVCRYDVGDGVTRLKHVTPQEALYRGAAVQRGSSQRE